MEKETRTISDAIIRKIVGAKIQAALSEAFGTYWLKKIETNDTMDIKMDFEYVQNIGANFLTKGYILFSLSIAVNV